MCDVEANTPGCKAGIATLQIMYDMVKFEESSLEVEMSLEGSQLASFWEASLCNIA